MLLYVHVSDSRVLVRAQTRFPESEVLHLLSKSGLMRFHVITRKVASSGERGTFQELAESVIVPGSYWDSLAVGKRVDWSVTSTFYSPSDETAASQLAQILTGESTTQAICIFRYMETGRERFGMVPGRTCRDSIGVLFVLAVKAHPPADFDGASQGFDLCVSRRIFQGERVPVEGSTIEPLQVKTRVTIGTPCGVARGLDKGLWEVAFYAARYPQARGIDGLPTSSDCPWRGSLQLGSKCFLKTDERVSSRWDFFSANEECRHLADGLGFNENDASLALIENDTELKLAGVRSRTGHEELGRSEILYCFTLIWNCS